METRNSKRRKNAAGVYNQIPEDSVDESTAALASLTAKNKVLLAEKTDLEARVERAEKHVKELEELLKLKDAELAWFVKKIEEVYEEMNAVHLQVQKTLKKV
ncbi:hypothetical protein V6N13_145339 [Hibiscus sabdariffa]|uniref:Uncharacterized protein n=1 Tax=Hibiscus sabdariffa TaxID=183260 RepID=A0ABR2TPA1_9ROSI